MTNVWQDVKANLTWIIRDGIGTCFWKDHWVPRISSLMDVCYTSMPIHESEFSVVNYTKNGNWDWDRLRGWFSQDVCAKLAVIKPPNPRRHDFPCWNLTSDGDFTLKSAYDLVHEKHAEPAETFPLYDLA